MTQPIRVVTVDAHPLFADVLARPIRQRSTFQLVGEASDGCNAVAAIARELPDVAVVRIQLPVLDGRVIVRAVVRRRLPTRVLLVGDADSPHQAYDAFVDGAAGWLTPAATPDQLCDVIIRVARGGTHFPPELHGGLAREMRLRSRGDRALLTPREQEILELIAAGLSGPQIAGRLHLAPATVKTHIAHLYDKLDVGDRAAAVAEAMRRGLLD